MAREVLVVDDDPAIRAVVKMALETEGYRVVPLADGREVLPLIERSQPDLVLLDLNMPLISGWEVHANIKRRRIPVPVVYMTAGARAQEEAERYGAAGYLAKPFDIDELLTTVERFTVAS